MYIYRFIYFFFVFNLLIFPKLRNTSSLNTATVVTPGSNYFRKFANMPLLNKLREVGFVCKVKQQEKNWKSATFIRCSTGYK